jgi:DeoR/GlpR family transcriptional regulator of sugar metabolism
MNWFNDERQRYIAELLNVVGHINRSFLIRKFGISTAQAANDLSTFQRRNPKAMTYDAKIKTYVSEVARRKMKSGRNITVFFHQYDGTAEKIAKLMLK